MIDEKEFIKLLNKMVKIEQATFNLNTGRNDEIATLALGKITAFGYVLGILKELKR